MFYLAQVISLFAMASSVLSVQCERTRNYFIWQAAASTLYTISYVLSGAYDSAVCNIIGILKNALVLSDKTRTLPWFLLTCVLSIVTSLMAYASPWSLVLLAQLLVGVYIAWYCDGATIRKVRFCFNSPIWLINNIFVSFNIGGILCDTFLMASIVISFIRYGKDGFEK